MEAYENLEVEFPILDKVGIRGVVFFDAGNSWNPEDQFCKTTPAPQFDRVVQPCFSFPNSLGYLRTSTGFGLRWFSPLGPLRFEWGFPLAPLSYENAQRFRVHDRQLLLRAEPDRRAEPRGRGGDEAGPRCHARNGTRRWPKIRPRPRPRPRPIKRSRLDPGRDADLVPRLRDERHHRARDPRCARRAQAGPSTNSL